MQLIGTHQRLITLIDQRLMRLRQTISLLGQLRVVMGETVDTGAQLRLVAILGVLQPDQTGTEQGVVLAQPPNLDDPRISVSVGSPEHRRRTRDGKLIEPHRTGTSRIRRAHTITPASFFRRNSIPDGSTNVVAVATVSPVGVV